jgi:hypothetical protein
MNRPVLQRGIFESEDGQTMPTSPNLEQLKRDLAVKHYGTLII